MALCEICGILVPDWKKGRPNTSCSKGTACYRERSRRYQQESRARRARGASVSLTIPPSDAVAEPTGAFLVREDLTDNDAVRRVGPGDAARQAWNLDPANRPLWEHLGGERPLMIDLFCGLGGASQPFVDAGWDVVRVDVRPDVAATVVTDIREFTWTGRRPTLLWASPPCDEFARLRMKQWHPDQGFPLRTLQLVAEVTRIYALCRPRHFVMENVTGAIPYLGKPARKIGPFCLWGHFPYFLASMDTPKTRRRFGKGARQFGKLARAVVPYQLGDSLRLVLESTAYLF